MTLHGLLMSFCAFTMIFFVTHKDFVWSHIDFMCSSQWLFVMPTMVLCNLHNHKLCTQNMDPHNDVVCPWNDYMYLMEILCDLLNDLWDILTMISISYDIDR